MAKKKAERVGEAAIEFQGSKKTLLSVPLCDNEAQQILHLYLNLQLLKEHTINLNKATTWR